MHDIAPPAPNSVKASSSGEEVDKTAPTDIDRRFAAGMLANRLPSTLTLAEAVRRLEDPKVTRPAASDTDVGVPSSPPRIAVDEALAEKPACLYGTTYNSADRLVRALVRLYSLELLIPKTSQYSIILPQARMPKTPEDFGVQTRRLVPGPLLRQYTGLSATLTAPSPAQADPADAGRTPEQRKAVASMDLMMRQSQGSFEALNGGYYPPARRLLVLAMPLVPTPTSLPVPVVKANPEVLRLISLMLWSTAFRSTIRDLQKPLAHCLAQPDDLVIKAYQTSDQHGVIYRGSFGYKDEEGVFHAEAGTSIRATIKQ